LISIVLTETERQQIGLDPLVARLVFAIKEAVYKASFQVDRIFLEHHDVQVSLSSKTASTHSGVAVRFRYGLLRDVAPLRHIAVLAWIPAGSHFGPAGQGTT
jgi:4'-phosphopantetheinyl transferase EntD